MIPTGTDEIAEIAGLRAGRVRLAAFPSASATLVPAAGRTLQDTHNKITVSLVEAEPPETLALLEKGETDVALAFGYPESELAATPNRDVVPLLQDDLVAVLPRRRRARQVELSDLANETWIAGCERCRAHLLHLARQAGFQPHIAYATDDYVTVQSLVAAGLGVALLPSLALAAHHRDDITTLPLAEPAARQIAAIVPPGPRHPPAINAMLSALSTAATTITNHHH